MRSARTFSFALVFVLCGGLGPAAFAPVRAADGLPGTYRALIVGVSDYDDEWINDLNYSVADARLLYDLLTDPQRSPFQPDNVTLLTTDQGPDHRPTRANVRAALEGLGQAAKLEDLVLVYFAGHGILGQDGSGYVVPADAQEKELEKTSLPMSEVNALLDDRDRMAAQRVIVILDSCHSGVRVGARDIGRVRGEVWYETLLSEAEGRVTLSACSAEERAYEDPAKGHGLFTWFLTKGLRGYADRTAAGNQDGLVSTHELHVYVKREMQQWCAEHNRQQTPRVHSNVSGEVVLARDPGGNVAQPDEETPDLSPDELLLTLLQPPTEVSADGQTLKVTQAAGETLQVVGLAKLTAGVSQVTVGDQAATLDTGSRALRAMRLDGERAGRFEVQLPLRPGEQTLPIQARNEKGEVLAQLNLLVRGEPPPTPLNPPLQRGDRGGSVALIGLTREQVYDYPELRTLQVARGLRNRLTRLVEDEPRFTLVEERMDVLEDLIDQQWMRPHSPVDRRTAAEVGSLFGARFVMYGEVYDFSTPAENKRTHKMTLAVQIRLVDTATGEYRLGDGQAEKEADPQAPDAAEEFDRSDIGQVADAALQSAFADLLKQAADWLAAAEGREGEGRGGKGTEGAIGQLGNQATGQSGNQPQPSEPNFLISQLPSATSGTSEGGLPILAVIGVQNEVKDKQWRDNLIGFGLASQIAQTFYNTRRFRLVEARPEVLEQIEKMVEETWADPKAVAQAGDLAQVAAALGVDYLAAGRVRSSSKRASGGGIGGVIGVSRQTTTVSVEINLFHRQTGQTDTAKGSGEVSDHRTTVWVQRDLHNLPFDHTTVGRATRAAIREAVKKLVPGANWEAASPPSEGGAGGGTHEGGAGGGTGSWTVGLLPLPRPLSAAVEKQYPELADTRVALGVHNRLVKALSATGRFTFVEIDEEVRQVLEQMRYIRETGTVPDEEALKKLADFDWPDWILVAEVSDFAKDLAETDNLSGKTQDRVTLQIQIRALDLNPHHPSPPKLGGTEGGPSEGGAGGGGRVGDLLVTGQGQAKGDWLKWKGEENFEQTFIGAAIDQALRQAVPALLAELGRT